MRMSFCSQCFKLDVETREVRVKMRETGDTGTGYQCVECGELIGIQLDHATGPFVGNQKAEIING